MISSLVAGFVLMSSQEVRRDFTFPVMSVSHLGEWIGKELNRLVIVSPDVKDRLVYVHLKGRSYPELYQYLEEAIYVKVIDQNGALTIVDNGHAFTGTYLSKEAVLKQISDSIREFPDRNAMLRSYQELDAIRKQLLSGQVNGQNFAALTERRNELQTDDPVIQAGFRFARDLGWERIMQLPEMERVVFSTNPTFLQRKWVGDSAGLIREISQSLADRDEINADLASEKGMQLFTNSRPIAEMRAVVRRYPAFVHIDTKFYASDGSLITSGQVSVNGATERRREADQILDAIDRIIDGNTEEFNLSEENLVELEQLRTFASLLSAKLTPDQLKWLSTIDEVEPLGGAFSNVYNKVLDDLGREAVFSVSPQSSFRLTDGKLTMEDAIRKTLLGAKIEGLEDEGRVLVRPRGQTERLTVSRTPLAEMARRLLKNGRLTLFDLSELSSMLEDQSLVSGFIREMLISSGQAHGNSNVMRGSFVESFILSYSKLPVGVRRQMELDGYKGAISNLVPPLPQSMAQAMRSTELGGVAAVRYKVDKNGELERQAPDNWPSSVLSSDWMLEQTEFMALKEFSPISLTALISNYGGLTIEETYTGQRPIYISTTIEDAAMRLANEQKLKGEGVAVGTEITGFTSAEVLSISLGISCGLITAGSYSFSFLSKPVGSVVPYEKLPQKEREAFVKALEEAKKRIAKAGPAIPLGGNPPPPPPY